AEAGLGVVELEERPDAIIDVRLNQGRAKAAVVFGVEDQQRGLRSAHRGQMRIVGVQQHVGGILLDISSVLAALDTRNQRSVSGDWRGREYTLVERAQKNRLPASA